MLNSLKFVIAFQKNQSGAFSLSFALSLVLILSTVGTTIDFGRSYLLKSRAQTALDSAVIASLKKMNAGEPGKTIYKAGKTLFQANIAQRDAEKVRFYLKIRNKDQKIYGKVRTEVDTIFLKMIGISSLRGEVLSEATGSFSNLIIDIAMCIDVSLSMASTLQAIKNNALEFDANLKKALLKRSIQVNRINIRPLFFTDYDSEGPIAIKRNRLFKLPKHKAAFSSRVKKQNLETSGNIPEAGIECFYEAIKTKWTKTKISSAYPVIALWTDAAADPPGNKANILGGGDGYPKGMPTTYAGLKRAWESQKNIDQENKIAILFGPKEAEGWKTLTQWDEFKHGGSVSHGTDNIINALADMIADKLPAISLYQ